MKRKHKIIIIIAAIIIFFMGYYLRAYLPLYKFLPLSPYEAFASEQNYSLLNKGFTKDFTDKATRYPTTFLFQRFLNPIFGNLYLIYIFGAIIIFFLGKEITNKYFGGFLAFSIYALAPENLLQYMRTIGASGSCYIFMWASLLFFIRYLKKEKNYNLILFTVFTLLALTSYHTGATAMIMILIGLAISLFYSSTKSEGSEISCKIDRKIILSFLGIIIFYIFWVKTFDPSQFITIINSFKGTSNLNILIIIFSFLLLITGLFLAGKVKFLQSEYLPLIFLIISAILIFSKFNFFSFLLVLGVKNYYSSSVTLNNYIAQALLVHVYILILLPTLSKKQLKPEQLVLRGWFIGLILIAGGLVMEHYYARIFDYSFPLMSILFALFWCKKKKFRTIIITATIILLISSQLMIYNDPFTMRRYYNQEEVQSAEGIIKLNLNGTIASDLRTAALFSYLGKKDIKFGRANYELHNTLFYEYENINNLEINYVILSESMKTIVYAMSFETTPINKEVFEYYRNNFKEVYNDKLMYVYEIK
jgi:hypothetical protein